MYLQLQKALENDRRRQSLVTSIMNTVTMYWSYFEIKNICPFKNIYAVYNSACAPFIIVVQQTVQLGD